MPLLPRLRSVNLMLGRQLLPLPAQERVYHATKTVQQLLITARNPTTSTALLNKIAGIGSCKHKRLYDGAIEMALLCNMVRAT